MMIVILLRIYNRRQSNSLKSANRMVQYSQVAAVNGPGEFTFFEIICCYRSQFNRS